MEELSLTKSSLMAETFNGIMNGAEPKPKVRS